MQMQLCTLFLTRDFLFTFVNLNTNSLSISLSLFQFVGWTVTKHVMDVWRLNAVKERRALVMRHHHHYSPDPTAFLCPVMLNQTCRTRVHIFSYTLHTIAELRYGSLKLKNKKRLWQLFNHTQFWHFLAISSLHLVILIFFLAISSF